jgi:hypothetical protein
MQTVFERLSLGLILKPSSCAFMAVVGVGLMYLSAGQVNKAAMLLCGTGAECCGTVGRCIVLMLLIIPTVCVIPCRSPFCCPGSCVGVYRCRPTTKHSGCRSPKMSLLSPDQPGCSVPNCSRSGASCSSTIIPVGIRAAARNGVYHQTKSSSTATYSAHSSVFVQHARSVHEQDVLFHVRKQPASVAHSTHALDGTSNAAMACVPVARNSTHCIPTFSPDLTCVDEISLHIYMPHCSNTIKTDTAQLPCPLHL